MAQKTKILLCRCSFSQAVPADSSAQAERIGRSASAELRAVDDLCQVAATDSESLRDLAGSGHLIVGACHPRAVRNLLRSIGLDFGETDVTWVDLRDPDGAIRLAQACGVPMPSGPETSSCPLPEPPPEPEWPAWFPIIDRDRCSDCRRCLDFCMFGVYELDDDGRVIVSRPQNCKNLCPACSRICPRTAVIFPKLPDEPYNGAEVPEGFKPSGSQRPPLSQLSGDDLVAALELRSRSAKRRLLKSPPSKGRTENPGTQEDP